MNRTDRHGIHDDDIIMQIPHIQFISHSSRIGIIFGRCLDNEILARLVDSNMNYSALVLYAQYRTGSS